MNITLRELTEENFLDADCLDLSAGQSQFVPSLAHSVSMARLGYAGRNWEPFVIYRGQTVIGAIVFSYNRYTPERINISGFYLGRDFQGKGLGKRTLEGAIPFIRDRYQKCSRISLMVSPENQRAIDLYSHTGFKPSGRTFNNEDEMVYTE